MTNSVDFTSLYPFWSQLSEVEKEEVTRSCHVQVFPKGTLMYRSKENCKGIMAVMSGQLRTYILSEEGREVTLFRVSEGEVCVLSASCLMDSIAFEVMIEATKDTEVLVLPASALNKLIKTNPYVELYLYKTATAKFSEVMWTLQQILFQRIDQRVAGFLCQEFEACGTTTLSMTHDEIARNIGSAREVVSKVLKYLAEHNAISLGRGKITLLDKEILDSFR